MSKHAIYILYTYYYYTIPVHTFIFYRLASVVKVGNEETKRMDSASCFCD